MLNANQSTRSKSHRGQSTLRIRIIRRVAQKPFGNAHHSRPLLEADRDSYDPSKPIASWKKAWRALTTKAGLKGLRFHDMRHTALTELYEDPNVSEQTIRSIAGHVSPRMAAIYSHTRLDAKRQAIRALSTSIKTQTSPMVKDRHAAAAATS